MRVRPVVPSRDDPGLVCPRDTEPMRRFDYAGVAVDRCTRCGGVWLDLGELHALLEVSADTREAFRTFAGSATSEPRTASVTEGVGLCPRDRMPLTAVRDPRQPHIEYDLCTHCGGVFFDAGELVDLSEFSLKERLRWMFPGFGGSA